MPDLQFDPLAFRGTAQYYALGRPPYSPQLAEALADELNLDGTGLLLDVGCGPGVLELRLHGLFEQIVALDPEAGMLAEGAARCEATGIINVRWVRATADELRELDVAPHVVTFGQSFHRVRRAEVADAVYEILAPGGSLVLIFHQADGRPRPAGPGYPGIPHSEVRELVIDFLGAETRRHLETWNDGQPRFEDTLRDSRFGAARTVFVPGDPGLVRDIDAVVANVFSMSYASPPRFGERRAEFEYALRALLAEHAPDGLLWEWPGDTELIIATKQ